MTHVLLTRPLDASEQLAGQLEVQGLSSIVMPLYTFAARLPSFDVQSVWSVNTQRILIVFTSTRAVEFGLSHLPANLQDKLQFAVIGSATGKALESAGYSVHLQAPGGYTSEDLLRMPELAIDPGQAVIFCAPGGRVALAEGLTGLGWKVFNAMVYERLPLRPESKQLEAILAAADLISVWTSNSAIDLAHEYLPEPVWAKILSARVLVISARIQHHLQQLGASRVGLADGPGNPELLRSIMRLTGLEIDDQRQS